MSLSLRRYQSEAIESIYRYFGEAAGNPLIVIPTAGGKSLVMAAFIKGVLSAHPEQRILILTHVRELIAQNFAELKTLWPQAPAGVYSAGLRRREIDAPVLFAGIQSVHTRSAQVGHCDLVLVDEAHLIPREANTMYRRFLAALAAINPQLKVIGLTATPYRLDSGKLHTGDGAVFTDIAYEVSVRTLIDAGYLAPLVSKPTETAIDVSRVAIRGGEYVAAALEEAVDRHDLTEAAVAEIVRCAGGRKSWLVFCSGVRHAAHVCQALQARGIGCATIVGDTPSAEREALIARFKAGTLQCLTNANVLTTGFNAPAVDLLAMLRPTQSTGLYVQMLGRGCRLAPGKDNCLVLDFAGNIARHGPMDAVDPRSKPDEQEGAAPLKTCPSCERRLPAAASVCEACGFTFDPPAPKLSAEPSALDPVSAGTPQWVPVSHVSYGQHHKPGGLPSLRVNYQSGLRQHSEWVCFEHPGYPQQRAREWWARRAPGLPCPRKVAEALAQSGALRRPQEIAVRPKGRYTEIVGARFA